MWDIGSTNIYKLLNYPKFGDESFKSAEGYLVRYGCVWDSLSLCRSNEYLEEDLRNENGLRKWIWIWDLNTYFEAVLSTRLRARIYVCVENACAPAQTKRDVQIAGQTHCLRKRKTRRIHSCRLIIFNTFRHRDRVRSSSRILIFCTQKRLLVVALSVLWKPEKFASEGAPRNVCNHHESAMSPT